MATTSTTSSTRTYQIDKAHSEAVFQVRHLITKVRGRFSDFRRTIQFDETTPERSSVEFTIQTASIDINEPDRDKHLCSDDFFSVGRFPTISFKSRSVTKADGAEYNVIGDLTIRGVSKEVTLPVMYLGTAKDPWGKEKVGFESETTLNRKDFGLHWNAPLETGGFLVGDEVKVSVTMQAFG